jgi:hypothetical protein
MRRYRVVYEPESDHPWIVLGDTINRREWVEVTTFNDQDDADRYVLDVQTRQQALESKR